MARQKVKLAFIVNDVARKATYKKRSKNVLKKVNELSTLCGIEACAIVYGPYEPEPEIWPSSPRGVQKVVSKFRTKPEFEQSKKKLSQDDYLKQRIVKGDDQLKKLRKENRENEMKMLMYEYLKGQIVLDNISMNDLNDLSWYIDHNLKDIGRILEAGYTDNGQGQIMTA
ncbi:agamous-like MADS-box protein AGL80-like, partial [Trifolium medium]|nr:agamous-like MADS-box protein AGL80-like [Trifolium medium]